MNQKARNEMKKEQCFEINYPNKGGEKKEG